MKQFRLFAFVMLALVILTASVFASTYGANNGFVTINHIEINNQFLDGLNPGINPIELQREGEVAVAVFLTGNPLGNCNVGKPNPCYTTKVRAEINGYELDLSDSSDAFKVEPNVSYRKVLRFVLPQDISSGTTSLRLEVSDGEDIVVGEYPVKISEIRHRLNVFDVISNPTNNVQAGQPLFTSVRLENLGDNTEASVKVTVAIPALGIQTSEYVDRLLNSVDNNNNLDSSVKDTATSNDLMLMIPSDVREGDYQVVVTLEYNRGRAQEQKTYNMHVKGVAQAPNNTQTQPSVIVNVDSQTQRVESGNGAVYKFSVANLGQQATSYSLQVLGVNDWADVRVDPSNFVVQRDGTSEAYVYVAPKEGVDGMKTFTVNVLGANNVQVAQKSLSLEVTGAKQSNADVKTVFTWIFVVLLVLLVLLVIVVLVKKLASKNNTEKSVEGQTYY